MKTSGNDEFSAQIARHLKVPFLKILVKSGWGAQTPRHRELIWEARQAFLEDLQKTNANSESSSSVRVSGSALQFNPPQADPPAANSSAPSYYQPQLIQKGFDFSISHSEALGGFAMLAQAPNVQIGFDLETISRVRPALVQRISFDKAEYQRAPDPAALWTAKEAAFKAFKGPEQPQTVSQIEITGWQSHSHFEKFELSLRQNSEDLKGSGITWTKDIHQFAIAVVFAKES